MAQRQIRGVFANFKVQTTTPDGKASVGLRSKTRGAMIDTDELAPGELERLERNGALMNEGGEVPADRLEEVLLRAVNPLDVVREDVGAPLSVAAPSLGAQPRGDYTKGDTGIDPADQPAPLVTGTITLGQGTSEEQAALDRMRQIGQDAPRTDAPDVEDTAALSEFIKTGGDAHKKLTVPETVALAEGDPDRARYVLEAEKAATGQDPRSGVSEALQKIIDEGPA